MEDVKTQLANRLKEANNVLVSVSTNPSVDQFAAAIGLTLMLNKLGKHATTVFSGTIPSLVEFLQPEKVVEKNTDSLRDFIISLDKAKADKLRYKIEDDFVKIFITPYHSSISDKDLVFSQGDFNVDVVVGLGVHKKEELDQAIIAHGRILHDATVTTINIVPPSELGSLNWLDQKSSSICEMLVSLADMLVKQGLLDAQISNALLTGIVAETQRFSNTKTTAVTMSASSKLLASGANQQLVATQLTPKPAPPPPLPPKPKEEPREEVKEPPKEEPQAPKPDEEAPTEEENPAAPNSIPKQVKIADPPKKKNDFGVLEIQHDEDSNLIVDPEPEEEKVAQVSIDEQGTLKTIEPDEDAPTEEEPPKDQPVPPVAPEPPLQPQPGPGPGSDSSSEITTPPSEPSPLPEPDTSNGSSGMTLPAPSAPADSQILSPPTGGSRQVMEPPPTDAQLSSEGMGGISDGNFTAPTNSEDDDAVPAAPSIPMMSHNADSAEDTATDNATSPQSGLPNLSDVRNAIDSALSSSTNVENQPLEALNSEEVKLNLDPTGSQAEGVATPQDAVPTPAIDPNLPPSVEPEVISPVSPPQDQTGGAPPVPPPIVPMPDNNLPPSYTAL